jgi:hypothetical protein
VPTETPEISILDELRRGGFEFSFATTYNAYLPFYEDVVWRHLTAAGCRANVLMMDGRQCAAALYDEGSRPRLAGREYTLIPARSRGAFHPKLLMLVGRERGLLFAGSHNMTVAGFGRNRELASRIEAAADDEAAMAALGEAWRFMRAWASDQPAGLLAAFDAAEGYAGWLRDALVTTPPEDARVRFFGSMPEGENLWQRVSGLMPEGVRRVTVISPFFDGRLRFLKRLAKDLKPEEFVVGVEPGEVVIDHDAARALHSVQFVDSKALREGKGYLHAKAVLVEAADESELLLTGSANASWQAWLAGGDEERNAEALVVTAGSKRQSHARALGLKELSKQPALSPANWEEIRRRAAARPKRDAEAHTSPLVALETEQGFDVEDAAAQGAPEGADLMGADGQAFGSPPVSLVEGGVYRVDVPEAGLRQRTWAVVLRFSGGASRLAIAHHTFNVAASAQTETQRRLRVVLDSLETDTPLLEDMLKIVERVIFDDFEAHQPRARAAGGRAGADAADAAADEAPQETYSVRLADHTAMLPHGRHAQLDDLGVLLSALNRRLGEGLDASVSLSPSIARSEEELVGSESEEDAGWGEFDGSARAASCRRRAGTMMRRMVEQLKLAAQMPAKGGGAVRQLAAVLGVLHCLRELEMTAGWMPYGETLIRERDERKFFLDATRLLYSQQGAVMSHATRAQKASGHGPTAPPEPSLSAALLLWLAWDLRVDYRNALDAEDPSATNENLHAVARLVAMAGQIAADDESREKATDAISRHHAYYEADGEVETWLEAHLGWMKRISEAAQGASAAPRRPADAGDVIYLKKGTPRPMMVLQQRGRSVRVVDLDEHDEQKGYGNEFITLIDM